MTASPLFHLVPDTDWVREPAPAEVVEGWLPAAALVGFVGPTGHGKTFVTLSLVTATALAPDWLGHRVITPGRVVYWVGEGHALFPRRLEALRRDYGLRDGEPSGVLYAGEPLSLLRPDDVTGLIDSVRAALPGESPRVVVFDPLASFMAGGDENSTADMSSVMAALNRLRAEFSAAIIVGHHTGWNAERERGSTVLRAALDALYNVKQDDGIITIECVKRRDGTPPMPLRLRLRPVADSCVLAVADETTAAQRTTTLTAKQQHALDTLHAIVIDEPVSYSRWKEATGAAESTFDRAAALLVRHGWVLKTGKGRNARYQPPGPLPPTPTSPPSHPHGGDPLTTTNPHSPLGLGVGGKGWGSTEGVSDADLAF